MSEPEPAQKLRLSVPTVSARLSPEVVSSTLARLIASQVAVTRAELVRVTGLARSTTTSALDLLVHAGLILDTGSRPTLGRGRPAQDLGINPDFGRIFVADVGVQVARLGVYNLDEELLASAEISASVANGPEPVLELIVERFHKMLADSDHVRAEPIVLVIGLPGPIDTIRGMAVKPPIMPGWDGYKVAEALRAQLGCTVLCDNDVNLRALGEARALPPDQCPLLYIKVASGIGGGLVTATGELYHGANGSAGDIGHIRVPNATDQLCQCGNYGCVEAVASAGAILRRLTELNIAQYDLPTTQDMLCDAIRRNDKVAVGLLREAAERIGEVVANLVHFYNPARIVVGGRLSEPSDDLLAGIRAVVYRRALPLATRNLVIGQPVLGGWSGVAGGLVVGIEHALSPAAMSRLIPSH